MALTRKQLRAHHELTRLIGKHRLAKPHNTSRLFITLEWNDTLGVSWTSPIGIGFYRHDSAEKAIKEIGERRLLKLFKQLKGEL